MLSDKVSNIFIEDKGNNSTKRTDIVSNRSYTKVAECMVSITLPSSSSPKTEDNVDSRVSKLTQSSTVDAEGGTSSRGVDLCTILYLWEKNLRHPMLLLQSLSYDQLQSSSSSSASAISSSVTPLPLGTNRLPNPSPSSSSSATTTDSSSSSSSSSSSEGDIKIRILPEDTAFMRYNNQRQELTITNTLTKLTLILSVAPPTIVALNKRTTKNWPWRKLARRIILDFVRYLEEINSGGISSDGEDPDTCCPLLITAGKLKLPEDNDFLSCTTDIKRFNPLKSKRNNNNKNDNKNDKNTVQLPSTEITTVVPTLSIESGSDMYNNAVSSKDNSKYSKKSKIKQQFLDNNNNNNNSVNNYSLHHRPSSHGRYYHENTTNNNNNNGGGGNWGYNSSIPPPVNTSSNVSWNNNTYNIRNNDTPYRTNNTVPFNTISNTTSSNSSGKWTPVLPHNATVTNGNDYPSEPTVMKGALPMPATDGMNFTTTPSSTLISGSAHSMNGGGWVMTTPLGPTVASSSVLQNTQTSSGTGSNPSSDHSGRWQQVFIMSPSSPVMYPTGQQADNSSPLVDKNIDTPITNVNKNGVSQSTENGHQQSVYVAYAQSPFTNSYPSSLNNHTNNTLVGQPTNSVWIPNESNGWSPTNYPVSMVNFGMTNGGNFVPTTATVPHSSILMGNGSTAVYVTSNPTSFNPSVGNSTTVALPTFSMMDNQGRMIMGHHHPGIYSNNNNNNNMVPMTFNSSMGPVNPANPDSNKNSYYHYQNQ